MRRELPIYVTNGTLQERDSKIDPRGYQFTEACLPYPDKTEGENFGREEEGREGKGREGEKDSKGKGEKKEARLPSL